MKNSIANSTVFVPRKLTDTMYLHLMMNDDVNKGWELALADAPEIVDTKDAVEVPFKITDEMYLHLMMNDDINVGWELALNSAPKF